MLVLVAGGAGFIGSHLCERLLAGGHAVVCLDDFSTGSRLNVAHLEGLPGFELLERDVTGPVELLGVDRVFNLACPAAPARYQADPVRTWKTSVLGTMHLLDLAAANGARFVQASTSEVYGDPQVHPQREDYWGHVNPIGPRACYDEGKRAAETLCFDTARTRGLDVRVARIFNTYGPRMARDDGRVVANFVAQALEGRALTLYGAGSQTRSFCYVSDLVEGLVRLMDYEGQIPGPVNLGNPAEFTVRELAELVLELTGSSSPIEVQPLPVDDPVRRCPDITRARTLLGWEPAVPLVQGLGRTIAAVRALR
ncbi:UDP-glucuronic acid decarboxylase family protein [Vulgatibacter sp.]|uniref:UDP-glucuronic acid decarboxylase family protein n=1 Tax=Vulgatibacter sp. TaxID=1971226 RepID=UPI003569F4F2